MSARRDAIENALRRERAEVERIEADLAEATGRRDRRIIELRNTPEKPSARYVADLAGISHTWVHRLEESPD